MPTTSRSAIVVALLLVTSGLRAADPPVGGARPETGSAFNDPELIAIAWASPKVIAEAGAPLDKSFTAWGRDGREIASAELVLIKKELREFGSIGRVESGRLPPLHLVFRIDPRAKNSQRLEPQLIAGDRPIESLAVQEGSSPNRLALSVLSVSKQSLKRWPAEIDVEIRVPIEEGDVFRTVDRLGSDPVSVAPGVRLLWTRVAAMDRDGEKLLPAVALEIERQQSRLVEHDFFTHLRDGTSHSFNAMQANETHDLRVSPPLQTRDDLDHIDLWRLRYRMELYDRLPIFPERIPGGMKNEG